MELNKVQNMLLGIAIGDAFGAGYEFLKGGVDAVKTSFDFTKYRKHPIENSKIKAGMYTDDTQMSIAICELLLSEKEFNHKTLADSFIDCYKRDPIDGYARGFQNFLDSINSGEEFLEKINPDSIRNGAAMRAVPLGIVPELEKVLTYAIINAELTHNTPQGIASSVCVALMSHYFLYEINKPESIYDYIDPYIRNIDKESADHFQAIGKMKERDPSLLFGEKNISKGVTCNGMLTAGAALYIVSNFGQGAKESLKQSVILGGDTDSVASISLGIIAIKTGLGDMPSFLFDNLTNSDFGRDYLIGLGENLSEKYRL